MPLIIRKTTKNQSQLCILVNCCISYRYILFLSNGHVYFFFRVGTLRLSSWNGPNSRSNCLVINSHKVWADTSCGTWNQQQIVTSHTYTHTLKIKSTQKQMLIFFKPCIILGYSIKKTKKRKQLFHYFFDRHSDLQDVSI